MTDSLLGPDEPPAVDIVAAKRETPFLLVCDHAGRMIPHKLGTLGVSEQDLQRHIAWDIGTSAVAEGLAARLGAGLIRQTYSRLVIDCNRAPHVPTSIATVSEATQIPGNVHLAEADREARIREIFAPYHAAIQSALDNRAAAGTATALIAIHSFTPVFKGVSRPWQAGLLYNRDPRLGRALLALMRAEGLTVGENEPYAVSDESDYTIPVHAERRSLPYAEIEIRQDLIADQTGQTDWAERLARWLPAAWLSLGSG